jgi:lysozyme family protein
MSDAPSTNFLTCFAFTLAAEGGYTANPADKGNWTGGAVNAGELRGTKYGISAAAYPEIDIANLTEADAQAIYQRDYWAPMQCDAMTLPVAMVAFDMAVNGDVRTSTELLQAAAGVAQDGKMGPETLAALNAGDPLVVAREALARRVMFYAALPIFPKFGLGWVRRVVLLAGSLG